MQLQIVEPQPMLGISKKVTNSTLIVPTVLNINDAYVISRNFKEVWIDNGAFEAGIKNSIQFKKVIDTQIIWSNKLIELGCKVYFIRPDVLMDCQKTIDEVTKYEKYVERELGNRAFMVSVLQFETVTELNKITKFYNNNVVTDMFAFPIRVRENVYRTMGFNLYGYLDSLGVKQKRLHNLGFSLMDLSNEGFFHCHSMDTSYPLKRLAVKLSLGGDNSRPKNYFKLKLDRAKSQRYIHTFKKYIDTRNNRVIKWQN
jgi:hypothetical protein